MITNQTMQVELINFFMDGFHTSSFYSIFTFRK